MKKKLILVVSFVLLLAMSLSMFVACGKSNADFKKFIKPAVAIEQPKTWSKTLSGISMTDKMSIVQDESTEDAIIIKTINSETGIATFQMVSVESGAITALSGITTYQVDCGIWTVEVVATDGTTYDVYGSDGAKLFNVKSVHNIRQVSNAFDQTVDSFLIQSTENPGNYYYIKNGKCVKTMSSLLSIPFYADVNNRWDNVQIGKDVILACNSTEIYLYDAINYSLISTYSFGELLSSNDELTSVSLLDDKNVVIQTVKLLPEDAKKYDYYLMDDGLTFKYDISTYKIDMTKKTAKSIEFNYQLNSAVLSAQTMGDKYNSNYQNYARASKFENGVMSLGNIVAFDNNLKVKFDASKSSIMCGVTSVTQVAENKYALSAANHITIVNEKGERINTFNNAIQYVNDMLIYGVGLRAENNLYGFDGSVIFDAQSVANIVKSSIKKIGAITFYSTSEQVVGGSEIVKHYRHDGSAATEIVADSVDTVSVTNGYFVTKNTNKGDGITSKTYYSVFDGSVLLIVDNQANEKPVTVKNDFKALIVINNGVASIIAKS